MTLESLFQAIVSVKTITINLYDSNDLLLITFGLPGYDALDDYLLDRKVKAIEILTLTSLNVRLAEQEEEKSSLIEDLDGVDDEL